jgi:hypothetical protein
MRSAKIGVAKIKRRMNPTQHLSRFFPTNRGKLDMSPGTVVARSHQDYDSVTVADSNGYVGIIKTWYEDGSPTSPS